ncbi:MAG: hypothetical protein ACR2KT_14835 [Methylocella sp.]
MQPGDIVDHDAGSGFDAAMIAVDGLMPADRRILDVVQKRSLIALERNDVIGLLVLDLAGDGALTPHV